MEFLRSNTAVIVAVGPFYDKTDGVTIKTALTITNEKITLVAETDAGSAPTLILDNITGATSATSNDLNYITNGDNGMMQMELAAADVNRVGRMKLSITDAANHVPVFHSYFVLPQAIFDWLTGVIVPLPANVTQLLGTAWLTPGVAGTPDTNSKFQGGTTQTGRDLGASVLLSAGTGTGQLDFTSGVVKANVAQVLGTAAATPATAGILEVNVKNFNNLAAVALPLVPTVAGRTLDCSAGGEAGVDWANVGSPTTTVGLSGTTVKTATDIATATTAIQADTDDIQTRIPAALVSGRMDSSVGAMAANVLTATAINADAITDAKVASDVTIASVTGAVGSVTGAVGSVTGAVGSVTGNVGGNVTGSVGSVAAGGITATSIATGAIDADALAADAVDEILDEQIGDGTITMRQALRILVAGMAGKLSGAATATVTIRNLADSANVVVATVDANGNRSAVTVTP